MHVYLIFSRSNIYYTQNNNLRPLMRIISSHDNTKKKFTWDKSRARKTWISWVHLNRRWHKHRKMTALPYLKIKKRNRIMLSNTNHEKFHFAQMQQWTEYYQYSPLEADKSHKKGRKTVNPSYPNISMYSLHNVLDTFPLVLTRRICITINGSFSWWSFPLFLWPECLFQE